ncbi:MAG: tRNA uridine-5-carboxymethylaminomethyl(34) synthesis GTPase MnmE [Candidatus Aureabacteria bacterium]|nr:tRNA uridine-5-carboxymethylaminomethyl(34) synthesis GTPase MnmE [Candidatus Auribacterota bacterium]
MDTIAAISTPIGQGGLGIIRITGPKAFSVIPRIFLSKKHGKRFSAKKQLSHSIHFGFLIRNNKKIDEVLMSIFKAPNTFTGEDTLEFSCHGGTLVLENALSTILENDFIRLAEQGEFSKKAFLNGRIDLIQAEAVADIIDARNTLALDAAVNQLDGSLSKTINKHKDRLISLLSLCEANIEFPEDDMEDNTKKSCYKNITKNISSILKDLNDLLSTFNRGSLLKQGINVVIIGAPNTGKSTLLNSILGFERAIVTSVAGTTRDFLKESLIIEGAVVNFIDTAGIRQAKDKIEKKGISKTLQAIEKATIVLHIIDGSRGILKNDHMVTGMLSSVKHKFLVVNKLDLGFKNNIKKGILGYKRFISISAKDGKGMNSIMSELKKIIKKQNTLYLSGKAMITSIRHKNCIERCCKELEEIITDIRKNSSEEIISHRIKSSLNYLDELSGATTPDDVLNAVFSKFCIGK